MAIRKGTRGGAVAAALAVALLQGHAQAADWRPERSIEFIVPAAAGGLNDTTMRNMQRVMQSLKLVDVPITVIGSTRSTRRFSPLGMAKVK